MFNRSSKKDTSTSRKSVKDLTRLQVAEKLLRENRRESTLATIRKTLHLDDVRYESLAQNVLNLLVNYYQSLPESTVSFYQHSGGLLDHALQRTEAALSIFQNYLQADEQGCYTEIQKLWQYALYTASLLQGIGKLYIDYTVTLYDSQGGALKNWNPLQESLLSYGSYYDYEFNRTGDEALRRRLNIILARQLMPISGFNWIASDEKVLAVWLALLNEDMYSAGTLGCILDTADAIAIQREMDRIFKHLGGGRLPRVNRLGAFNDRPQDAVSQFEQQTGIEFIQWVKSSLASGALMINKPPLFVVPGGLLMSVDIFKLFVRENPQYKNWQVVQKGFISLGLHENAVDGSLISKFEQHKNQHLITGITLGANSAVVLPAEAKMQQLGSGEIRTYSAPEMLNQMRYEQHFQPSAQQIAAIAPLQTLSANGQWDLPSVNSHPSSTFHTK